MNNKLRVLIPAGGRSSRSGLAYPKTLYRLQGIPILVRILNLVSAYDAEPIIVINPAQESLFKDVLQEFGKKAKLVFQQEPKGMGDAVLKAAPELEPESHLILIWSDIPLLSEITLQHLVHCHITCKNDFSLITRLSDNCYTIVERENGKVVAVKETKVLGIPPAKDGERDIGVFVFKVQDVFAILEDDAKNENWDSTLEHGFLYTVNKLVKKGKKVEGYPISLPLDVLSFNTPADLEEIERNMPVNS